MMTPHNIILFELDFDVKFSLTSLIISKGLKKITQNKEKYKF